MREGKLGRVLVARFRRGDDVLERLNELMRDNGVVAGSLTGVGAVEKAKVGYHVGNGRYAAVSYDGPLEVLSCIGNVSLKDGAPFVHAHMTVADSKGKAYGGHLMPGCIVGATFEVTVLAYEGMALVRKLDRSAKLFLLDA